jgi:hypothetical protein
MSFTVKKTFTITDSTYIPQDDGLHFITNFYKLMVDDGVIQNPIVPTNNFLLVLEFCKAPYYESDKIISNTMTQINPITYHWTGVFESAEVYNDYCADLLQYFNTDFNSSIKTSNISLDIEYVTGE